MNVNYPYRVGGHRLTAQPKTYEQHVYQMIEQILLTRPGERVNRPDFGCDLRSLTFAAGNENLIIGTQAIVQAALQRWLSDVIKVEAVEITINSSAMFIKIAYVILKTQQRQIVQFEN